VFTAAESFAAEGKCLCGPANLRITERHGMKHRGRPRASHIDENCVIVEDPIRGDRRVKVRGIALQKTVVQYFTSLGKEHYREGMFKLVKRWDKCMNDGK
jgi:hypothetical protein